MEGVKHLRKGVKVSEMESLKTSDSVPRRD